MTTDTTSETVQDGGAPPPPSAHFLNNVLAALASYVDDEPDTARELLADLGQYLGYRLRGDTRPVPLGQELGFVRTYLRLEHGRFPDRLHLDLELEDEGAVEVVPISLQERVQQLVGARLRERPNPLRVALRLVREGQAVRLDLSDWPDGGQPERHVLEVATR